jgi:ribosomal protein S27E
MKRFFTAKPTRAFQYKCDSCKDYTDAVLSKDQKEAHCNVCGNKFNVTTFTIAALKLAKSKNIDSSIEDDLNHAKNRLDKK